MDPRLWEKFAQENGLAYLAHQVGGKQIESARISGLHQGFDLTVVVNFLYETALFALRPTDLMIESLQAKVQANPAVIQQAATLFSTPLNHITLGGEINFNHLPLQFSYKAPQQNSNYAYWQGVLLTLKRLATAAFILFAAEGRAVQPLLTAKERAPSPLQKPINNLLTCISDRASVTTVDLVDRLWCAQCATQFALNPVTIEGKTLTFFGCRTCYQNQVYIDSLHRTVIMILDYAMGNRLLDDGRILQVNWLAHRHFFDFDAIVIIEASDQDVERLIVQLGNWANATQQLRYQQMRCQVARKCNLSENTWRILRRQFAQVVLID